MTEFDFVKELINRFQIEFKKMIEVEFMVLHKGC